MVSGVTEQNLAAWPVVSSFVSIILTFCVDFGNLWLLLISVYRYEGMPSSRNVAVFLTEPAASPGAPPTKGTCGAPPGQEPRPSEQLRRAAQGQGTSYRIVNMGVI